MIKTKSINSKFCLYTICVLVILLLFIVLTPKVFAVSSGPNSAGTGANDTSFGSLTWTNPGNITASDNVYATRAVSSATNSNYLKATNFGFSIPSGATINGITAEIERKTAALNSTRDVRVSIVKSDGTIGSTNKADTSIYWPTADTFKTYGDSSDLWGETWTYTDINDADFGAVLSINCPNCEAPAGNASVDNFRITIYYAVDTTAPTISSVASSTTATAATVTWTTNESATSTVNYGLTTAYGSASTSASLVTSHSIGISGLAAETLYHFNVSSGDASNNSTTTSDYTFTTADVTAPIISSVIPSSIASTSAAISWTTNEIASSFVDLGFVSNSYSYSTPESDTSPRVTSHSIALSNLIACSVYHYRVRSTDASSNAATSTDSMFATTGCTASALVMASSTTAITTASGGSVSLLTDSIGPTLTVPTSFSSSNATFQIKQLDKTSVISSISVPSGYSALGSHIYDFRALSATSTSISSFDSTITVSIAYNASDVSGMDESSLKIYRYDGSSWNQLSSCSVNTSTKTISCATTAFSTFGLFGSASVSGGGGPGYLSMIYSIGSVTDVSAIAGDSKVSLFWTNPMDSIFDHIVIIRKRGPIPSLNDGIKVFSGNANQFIDTNVLNNEVYYYAVYAVDSSNGVSFPMIANAIPQATAISSSSNSTIPEVIDAVHPAPRGIALGFNFVRPIAFGMSNNEIKNLQEALKTDSSIYPEGYVTGYFGPLTLKAVKRFQLKYYITTKNGPGYGHVGPKTRKKLNEIK